ncbi:hypothetical protein DLD77_00445 [Chitinophaga alhagiae]|uniref:PKD domain-containing protein n=1 Tax=Chitinophaga alhagiae TaxID=2203219 RepID=A0ABN5LVW2_9BACT|nr:PKD domain-containing protein [Chitinophaga alhagiae]AWO00282.1 hypothetical protein DLD77_00445 [Chitinophaga alhagiae]
MKKLLLGFLTSLVFCTAHAQEYSGLITYFVDKQAACDSITVTFTADTTNIRGVIGYTWILGNGDSIVAGHSMAYTYRQPGLYRPYLQVELEDGRRLNSYLLRNIEVGPLLEILNIFYSKKDEYRSFMQNIHHGLIGPKYTWSTGNTERPQYIDTPGVYMVSMEYCNKVLYDTAFAYEIPELSMEVEQIPASWDLKVRLKTPPIYPAAHTNWAFWNFGDGGGTSNVQSSVADTIIEHVYPAPGTYTVKFNSTNTYNHSRFYTQEITLVDTRFWLSLGQDTTIIYGDTILLQASNPGNGGAQFLWNTGDTLPQIRVTEAGTYSVAVSKYGRTLTDEVVVSVNDSAIARMGHNSTVGCLPLMVDFWDASVVRRGSIVSRKWKWGQDSSSVERPVYTFTSYGTHLVELEITDDQGRTSHCTDTLILQPYETLAVDLPDTAWLPDSAIPLHLEATYYPGAHYYWSRGDTGRILTIEAGTQDAPGTYILRVERCDTTITDSIIVMKSYGDPAIAYDPFVPCLPVTVQFRNVTVPGRLPLTYSWWIELDGIQIPSNGTYSDSVFSHTFEKPGLYEIGLEATTGMAYTGTRVKVRIPDTLVTAYGGTADTVLPAGGSIQLKALQEEHTTYAWSTGDTASAITVYNPGVYAVTATRCGKSDASSITVHPPDTATINLYYQQLTGQCRPFRLRFSIFGLTDTTGIRRFDWVFTDPLGLVITDSVARPERLFFTEGNYSVQLYVQYVDGRAGYGKIEIPLKEPVFTLESPFQTDTLWWCGPYPMQLNAGNPGARYQWSGGTVTGTDSLYTVTNAGMYKVRISRCSKMLTDSVYIANPPPVSLVGGTQHEFCNDDTLTLEAVFPDNWPVAWLRNGDTIPGATGKTLAVTDNAIYMISATNGNCNISSSTVTTRRITLEGQLTYARDTLFATGSSNVEAGFYYSWYFNGHPVPGYALPYYIPAETGYYQARVGNFRCLAFTDSMLITITPATPPAPEIVVDNNADQVTLSFTHPQQPEPGNEYTVQMSGSGGAFTREMEAKYTTLAVIPSTERSIDLLLNIPDSVPCSDDYRIRIISSKPADTSLLSTGFRIENMPEARINAAALNEICAGTELGLEAKAAYLWTYSWLHNGQPVAGADESGLTVTQPGEYRVVVSNGPGCTVTSGAVRLTVHTPVVPALVQRGDSLTATPAASYQWYRNGQLLDGATQATIRAPGSARYTVHTTDANGCKAVSDELSVMVTAIDPVTLEGSTVKLFPNPASGKAFLQFSAMPAPRTFVRVTNAAGLTVYTAQVSATLHELPLTGLPAGIYFVQVSTKKEKISLRLFVR